MQTKQLDLLTVPDSALTQPSLFDLPDPIELPPPPVKVKETGNPCIKRFGPGPEGATCKTCKHVYVKIYDKHYNKCEYRKDTNGAGSDHKMKWPACARYEAGPRQ